MTDGNMAWAIFTRRINWPRPGTPHTFEAFASDEPQCKPRDFVDAAVAAGAAKEVEAPGREAAKATRKSVKRS